MSLQRPAAIVHPFPEPPGPGAAIAVADGVLWMRLPLPMALDHVNVYALDDGDGWTLVDTGFDGAASRTAWAALRAGPLAGRSVHRVIATHHHPDHIGLAGAFQAEGAALVTTRTAWLLARMLTLDVEQRPSAHAMAFAAAAGLDPARLGRKAAERPFNFADVVAPLPPTYTRIAEGDRITAGGRTWRVRIGHGHAPEHATLWEEGGPLVIAGDQVLPGISPHLGIFPTEPDANPVADWIAACTALAVHARPEHLVLPGHKTPFTGLRARLDGLVIEHRSALDRLAAHLGVPRPATDCFEPLFRRPIREAEHGLALSETLAHLAALVAEGRAVRRTDAGGVWQWQAVPGV